MKDEDDDNDGNSVTDVDDNDNNNKDDNGDGATDNNIDNDGDGVTGDDNDDNGNGVVGDDVNDNDDDSATIQSSRWRCNVNDGTKNNVRSAVLDYPTRLWRMYDKGCARCNIPNKKEEEEVERLRLHDGRRR
jgi:hypothetical protein